MNTNPGTPSNFTIGIYAIKRTSYFLESISLGLWMPELLTIKLLICRMIAVKLSEHKWTWRCIFPVVCQVPNAI